MDDMWATKVESVDFTVKILLDGLKEHQGRSWSYFWCAEKSNVDRESFSIAMIRRFGTQAGNSVEQLMLENQESELKL